MGRLTVASNLVRYGVEELKFLRSVDDVKLLAHRLVTDHGVVALLATRTHDLVRVVCARSADLPVEANTLLQSVCEQIGGRSGGKSEFAQGSGTRVAELECALARAVAALTGENVPVSEKTVDAPW